MRRVDRASVLAPASLVEEDGAGAREHARAQAHYANAAAGGAGRRRRRRPAGTAQVPDDAARPFEFRAYKGDDVKAALEALFHGKCAYCESPYAAVMHVQVEHYRPKRRVFEDVGHPGYWWLASEWSNLLPSCAHCNGNGYHLVHQLPEEAPYAQRADGDAYLLGKLDYFPVASHRAGSSDDPLDDEDPQILDPTRHDPADHLQWVVVKDMSLVAARQTDGEVDSLGYTTYRLLGLNRQKLVEQRTERMLRVALELQEVREDLENASQTSDARLRLRLIERATGKLDRVLRYGDASQPYSMMANALIDSCIEGIDSLLASCRS